MTGPSYSKISSASEGVREAKTSAGLWSRLSFAWLSGIFALGNHRPLDETDLFKAVDQRDSQEICAEFLELWTEEMKTSKNPRVWKALLRLFSAWEYIFHTCSLVLLSCLLVSQPVFLNFLLRELSSDSSSTGWICFHIAGLSVSGIVKPFLKSNFYYAAGVIGTHINTAITGLVYRKILTSLRAGRLGQLTSAHIINLISKDQQPIHYAVRYIPLVITGTIQLICVVLILWWLVAVEAVAGISCFILIYFYKSLMTPILKKLRGKAALLTDQRLRTISDVISGIRVLKMNAWEGTFQDLVGETRRREIFVIGQKLAVEATFIALQSSAGTVATLVSVATMIARGHLLTVADVFTIYTMMSSVSQTALRSFALAVRFLADSSVTLKRVESLLLDFSGDDGLTCSRKNLLDKKAQAVAEQITSPDTKTPSLILQHVTCEVGEKLLLDDVALDFHGNQLIVITGPVGSGKSSLLSVILGELNANKGRTSRNGSIAYCPQTPWLFTGTISENLLFGRNLDELKYQQTIEACALKMDFDLLPDGDHTLIGERGVSLSGGQQSRINLARAVYSAADIYLLDDPLSAVDAKVGRHIFERCILENLGNSLRVLVTHRVEYLKHADCIVVLQNGRVRCQGKYEQLLTSDEYFIDLIRKCEKHQTPCHSEEEAEADKRRASHLDASSSELWESEGFQIVEEDRETGSVSGETYWTYVKSGVPLLCLVVVAVLLFLPEGTSIAGNAWLAKWADLSPTDKKESLNFWIYTVLALGTFLLSFLRAFVVIICALRAAEKLHSRMLVGLLMSPVRFFDTNPSGRIMNRFARCVGQMDEFLPSEGLEFLRYLAAICSSILLVSVVNPWLVLASVPFIVSVVWLAVYFLRTSRELKRLEAISCSPLYAHVAETIDGVAAIRAYSMEEPLINSLYRYRDKGNSCWLFFVGSKQWLCLYAEVLSAIFLTVVAVVLIFTSTEKALVGLSISYSLDIAGRINSLLTEFGNTENFMTSVERVLTYSSLEPEPGYEFDAKLPGDWPKQGSVSFKNVCFRYYPGGQEVLKDVNIEIHNGERVGIVGRTGAGKSSLVAAIYRMPESEGDILIDNIAIRTLNLQDSRSAVAAISQNPLLFTGSLRFNLDPENKYTDKALWDVLEDVNLKQLVQKLPKKLENHVTQGGGNFSVGERQLLCVARALLQNKKIVVLDEATANVDLKTDRLLQEVIRSKLKGRTVLTIAHRLETILDYDKVLVMDSGRVTEFDTPRILLEREDSEFARLYNCSVHEVVQGASDS